MKPFFIIGQPRSRTAWLANFMTYQKSFCFHEASRLCSSPKEIRHLFEKTAQERNIPYVGTSDSGLPLFWDEVVLEFGNFPIVLVERDLNDVSKSVQKAFSLPKEEALLVIDKTQKALDKIKKEHNPLIIPFKDLGKMEVCQKVWNHCLSGVVFDAERWKMLDLFKVEIQVERYLKEISQEAIDRFSEKLNS